MNTGLLGGIIFVVVFAGSILLHELGHFIVARLLHIEVEEFGIGFPPRLARLWRGKGSLVIGKKSLIIPYNFDLPFDPNTAVPHAFTATATSVRGKLVLNTIAFAALEDGQYRPAPAKKQEEEKEPAPQPVRALFKPKPRQPGEILVEGILHEVRPGTEFTMNFIPLGGFNKIKGEDDPSVPGGMASANPWKRIAVMLAGAATNLLTAVLVFTIYFSQIGIPDQNSVAVAFVDSGSPAELSGLKINDIILVAGGVHVTSYGKLVEITQTHLDKPMPLVVLRDGQPVEITVTPRSVHPASQGAMGIAIGQPLNPSKSWFATIPFSFSATGDYINNLLALPGRIIAGAIKPQEAQLAGPRTIWNLFQTAVARDVASRETSTTDQPSTKPTNYTLSIIISLTISLGVVNLLPIPALDGGRIFMTLPEIIFRRRIPAKFQAAINSISFLILIVLLGMFYIKDIISPLSITLP